jgi:hypothetical protein
VASPPWSLARAFARAGFAAFLGLALASVYYILEYASYYDIAQYVLGCVVSGAVFGGVVAGVERFIPQLRIPGGSAYGAVRNNGWAVALLLGLLAGVLFLPLVGIYDVVFVVAFVVAFFIAEAVFGRRFSAATAAKSA